MILITYINANAASVLPKVSFVANDNKNIVTV